MRILKIKNGDVVAELREILPATHIIRGGHLSYISSFFKCNIPDVSLLIISAGSVKARMEARNMTAQTIGKISSSNTAMKLFNMLFSIFMIFKHITVFKPDIIISTNGWAPSFLPAYVYALLFKKKLILSVHGDLNSGIPVLKLAEKHVIRRANAVIVHGPFLKNQVACINTNSECVFEYNEDSTDMLVDSIDKEIFALTSNGSIKLITYIGKITESKGVADLLDAYACSLGKNTAFRLIYAGEGPYLQSLRSKCSEAGMTERVIFLGKIARPLVSSLIMCSWAVVTPTQSRLAEGRCMSALESLSLGTPVIAPDYGAFKCLVRDGVNGLAFTPDDVRSLSMCLLRVADREWHQRLKEGADANAHRYTYVNGLTYYEALSKCYEYLQELDK